MVDGEKKEGRESKEKTNKIFDLDGEEREKNEETDGNMVTSEKREGKERRQSLKNLEQLYYAVEETQSVIDEFCITRGTFHQGDRKIFKDHSAGVQCTANAAVSIVMSLVKSPASWTPRDVDSVLIAGDEVYRRSIENRPRVSDEVGVNIMYLNALELVRDISIMSTSYHITVGVADLGHLHENIFGCLKLKDRLKEFLKFDRSTILTANGVSMAVGKNNGQIWMFDSHSRDANGKRSSAEDAAACLTLFGDIDSLYELIN